MGAGRRGLLRAGGNPRQAIHSSWLKAPLGGLTWASTQWVDTRSGSIMSRNPFNYSGCLRHSRPGRHGRTSKVWNAHGLIDLSAQLLSPLQKYATLGSLNTDVLSVINHFTKAQHNISTLRYISTETIKFPRRERDIDSLLLRRELFWYIHCWYQEVWTRTSISDHSCEAELFYDNIGDSKELNQIIILFFW